MPKPPTHARATSTASAASRRLLATAIENVVGVIEGGGFGVATLTPVADPRSLLTLSPLRA
jgi:hypothetical protein